MSKGINEIANYLLAGCNKLTNIEIPEKVTQIGNSAFLNCSNLESIKIPQSVIYI